MRRFYVLHSASPLSSAADASRVLATHAHTYMYIYHYRRLMKAGLVGKGREQAVSRASGWAELLGYAASIALNLTKIQAMLNQEQLMRQELVSMNKASGG